MPKTPDYSPEVDVVLSFVKGKIVDGLKHGYFDYSVSCGTGNRKQREVVVNAGEKHKFTIAFDKLPD